MMNEEIGSLAFKDEVCESLLFDSSQQILTELALTEDSNKVKEFLEDLYLDSEEPIVEACAETVDHHNDDLVDLQEKLGVT